MYRARIEWIYDQQPSLEQIIQRVAADPGPAMVIAGGLAALLLIGIFSRFSPLGGAAGESGAAALSSDDGQFNQRRRQRRRGRGEGLKALSPSQYNIVLADLDGDPSGHTTDQLARSLRTAFEGLSDSLPVTISLASETLPDGGTTLPTGRLSEALRRHHANLIVDGKVDAANQSVQLNSLSSSGSTGARGTWSIPLDDARATVLASDLALAMVEAQPTRRDGVRLIAPITHGLRLLAAANPPTFKAACWSRLLLTEGRAFELLARATGESIHFRTARDVYDRHLAMCPPGDGVPASAQCKAFIGQGRSSLALAQASRGEADVQTALMAFRKANEDDYANGDEATRTAKSGLAETLGFAGMLSGDTNRLGESIAVARDTLKAWPSHIEANARTHLVSVLGLALLSLGEKTSAVASRDEGIARLKEAAAVYRGAGQAYRAAELEAAIATTEPRPALQPAARPALPPLPPPIELEADPGLPPEHPDIIRARRLSELDDFIARHRAVARGLSRDKDRGQWVQVQFQLADAMAERADVLRNAAALREAKAAMLRAREAAVEEGGAYFIARTGDSLERIARTAAFHHIDLDAEAAPVAVVASAVESGQGDNRGAALADAERADDKPSAPPAVPRIMAAGLFASDHVVPEFDNRRIAARPAEEPTVTTAQADTPPAETIGETEAVGEATAHHVDGGVVGVHGAPVDVMSGPDAAAVEPVAVAVAVTGGEPEPTDAMPATAQADATGDVRSMLEVGSTVPLPLVPEAYGGDHSPPHFDDPSTELHEPVTVEAAADAARSASVGERPLSQRLDADLVEINRLAESGAVYRAALARDARERALRALSLKDGALARDERLMEPAFLDETDAPETVAGNGDAAAMSGTAVDVTSVGASTDNGHDTQRDAQHAAPDGAEDGVGMREGRLRNDDRAVLTALRSGRKALRDMQPGQDPAALSSGIEHGRVLLAEAVRLIGAHQIPAALSADVAAFVSASADKAAVIGLPYLRALSEDVLANVVAQGGENEKS